MLPSTGARAVTARATHGVARSLLRALALALVAAAPAACADGDDPEAPEPLVDGRWTVTRTVDAQPAGCRRLGVGTLDVRLRVDGTPAIEVVGARLVEWEQEVTATTARFVTEEYAFAEDPGRPVLIGHELHWLNSLLIGTGGASGDGDDLECHWSLALQAVPNYL